ncbi:MAG: leucyl/phenylalanyl-tRNA--protein transferase [Cryomorphaceae bacterium]|nr:MAG: leucyl/phenylalanyl-tRNA--protein transferase [Cryomorphaceae bacterium]
MAIKVLHSVPDFPPVENAQPDGLLALGGQLSSDWLLKAYRQGIFPWFNEGDPVLWWSPNPRMVLFPDKLKVSKSMGQLLARDAFRVTMNQGFSEVIAACAEVPRQGQPGTWITHDMRGAYIRLNQLGHAHSVEVWNAQNELAGGLYGVAIGKVFFGESMFTRESNASKFGFIRLVQWLRKLGFELIDCQMETTHLASLGAESIAREHFVTLLQRWTAVPSLPAKSWKMG